MMKTFDGSTRAVLTSAPTTTGQHIVTKPRVVVIGAGFGELSAVKALARTPVEVIIIDEQKYHLFQPLLYQVATAGLSPADIAAPIRGILARQRSAAGAAG